MSYRRKKNNLVTNKDEEEKSSIIDLSDNDGGAGDEDEDEYNNDEKNESDDDNDNDNDEANIENYLTEYQNKTGIGILKEDEEEVDDDIELDDKDNNNDEDDLQEDADDFDPAKGDEYETPQKIIQKPRRSADDSDGDGNEEDGGVGDDAEEEEEDEEGEYEVIDAEPILDEPSIAAAEEEVKTNIQPVKEGGKPKKNPVPKIAKKSTSLYIDKNTEFSDPVYIEQIKARYEYKPKLVKEIVYIHPENRLTSERMTIFEYAEVISIRAKQIQHGAPCYTDVEKLTDPIRMAKKEIEDRRCPLDIVRMITDKIAERWHVNEMITPNDFST